MGYSNPNPIVENNFMIGKSSKRGNTQTDGKILLLFGNRIAEHREDGVYITNCGYFTNTTKAHLNLLPSVSIYQKKGEWYLNGNLWDGKWIRISEEVISQQTSGGSVFDTTTQWVKTDAWRGYDEPIYAVCGANNTGSWDDSPCPTYVCNTELREAMKALKNIPTKCVTTESSNVFCVHRYVIVPPSFIDEARKAFAEYYETVKDSTRLLYAV